MSDNASKGKKKLASGFAAQAAILAGAGNEDSKNAESRMKKGVYNGLF